MDGPAAVSAEALPDSAPPPRPHRPQRDLTNGPVATTLLLFALPSLGVNILQSVNHSVNSVWIGRFLGEEALAATANAGMVMFLMLAALFGFSMATTILIGQYTGRGDIDKVRQTLGSSVSLFFLSGVSIALTGWIFAPDILAALGTPKGASELALSYLRVMFLSMPTSFVMILLSSSLRGVGDSITPMWATIANVALDIVLNPLFILGWGFVPAMGIAGSALATVVAGLIATAFLIRRIYAQDAPIRLRGAEWAYLRPRVAFLGPITRMGLPMGLSMIIMSLSALVMIALINREGVDTTAAYGVLNQLWNYVTMPAVAVGSAVSAMAAQNIGANRWDRVGRIALAGSGINIAISATILGAMTLFARPLLGLFLPGAEEAVEIAIHINHMIGWTFVVMGVSMVVTFLVRANGAVWWPLIILIIAAVVVRFSIGFGLYERMGADAIWWAFIATSLTSMVLSLLYYRFGKWRELSPIRRGQP